MSVLAIFAAQFIGTIIGLNIGIYIIKKLNEMEFKSDRDMTHVNATIARAKETQEMLKRGDL